MIHRCHNMVNEDNKTHAGAAKHSYCYYYCKKDGVWNLFDEGEPHRHEPAIFCEWCGVSLKMFQEGVQHSTHQCDRMVAVETPRNKENVRCERDPSYLIRWLPKSGWTLLYKGYPTSRINLDECMFCHIVFPFFNQVLID